MGIKTAIKTNSVSLFLVLLPALDCLGRFLFWFKIVFNLSRHSDCVKQLTSSLMNTSCLANSIVPIVIDHRMSAELKKKELIGGTFDTFQIYIWHIMFYLLKKRNRKIFFKMPLEFYQSHLVEEVCTAISSSHQGRTMSCDSCFLNFVLRCIKGTLPLKMLLF